MHLCEKQLRDVNPKDILNNGLYRRCNTYKGGGGYDKFSEIYINRTGQIGEFNEQFVVQLKGCPLRCPYCYVTEGGVHTGLYSEIPTKQLIKDFYDSSLYVLHLMGGAPALYIDHWKEILEKLESRFVFHSDLLLVESEYSRQTIEELAKYNNSLYAVSIKGGSDEEFKRNTGVVFNKNLFWKNFDTVVECKLPFYLTFTGMTEENTILFKNIVIKRYGEHILDDSFSIKLINYDALK